MGDVTTIYQAPVLRRDVADAAIALDVAILEAIDAALEADVPPVMILGILHTRLQFTTEITLTIEDEDESD